MKAIKFDECNVTFAEDQPEYFSLPAHRDRDGVVTTCWKLSFLEWVEMLLTGKLYLQVLTFNQPIQPLKMVVTKPPMRPIKTPDELQAEKEAEEANQPH